MAPFIPKYQTHYKDLVPPLAEEEYQALESDIEARGLLQPILIDESNNILDGHHRYAICCRLGITCEAKVIRGLNGDLEKRLFVLQSNSKRRNLDQAGKELVRQHQIEIYGQLRQKDPKKWTLEQIAKQCGVDRSTVGSWFSNETCPIPKQDARRKLTVEQEAEIKQDLESGEPASEVAKKYGVSKGRVSQIKKEVPVDVPLTTAFKPTKKAAVELTIPEQVAKNWKSMKQKFAVADLPEVRKELRKLLKAEEPARPAAKPKIPLVKKQPTPPPFNGMGFVLRGPI